MNKTHDIRIDRTKLHPWLNYKLTLLLKQWSKKVGLAWGGDWVSPVDTPHFYLGKWGDTPAKLKSTYGTFKKFKKTWTKEVFGTKKGLNIWNKTRTKVLKKKLPNKTKVNVMYVKKGYAKVEYNGVVGYMKAKYLL